MKTLSLSRLPVYVDQDVHPIYEKLTSRSNKKAEDFPFETMKDLFIAAACVGAKYGRYVDIKKTKEIFDGTLFNQKTEVPVLISLAYQKSNDMEILYDGRQVLDIAQGWANGGIQVIEDQLLNKPGRPLINLVSFLWDELLVSEKENTGKKSRRGMFSNERDDELVNEKTSKNFNIADCADLLMLLEVELRKFISDTLAGITHQWWKQRVPDEVRQRAENRKKDREEPYPGREKQDRPIYDYLDFADLATIITMKLNWDEAFKAVFKRREVIEVKLSEINPCRNDIAHHRDIPVNDKEIFVSNARQVIRTIRERSKG
jgi:hypothetical protein